MAALFVDKVDIKALLKEPEKPDTKLNLPPEWQSWDKAFQEVRDAINKFLDVVDQVPGIDISMRLPGGSLVDIVVKPFTGDWDRIYMNGSACKVWGEAVGGLGTNVGQVALDMLPRWSGKGALSFAAHQGVYAVVISAIGALLHYGEKVFQAIGNMSKRLGETVVKVLTRLGKLLIRVLGQVAKRLAGWWAWVKTAAEVLVNGLDVVRDIYNDVVEIIELVKRLFDLKAKVEAWVSDQVAKLKLFQELPNISLELPNVTNIRLAEFPPVDQGIKARIDAKVSAHTTKEKSQAEKDLEGSVSSAEEAAE
jgi:hypothetical protein